VLLRPTRMPKWFDESFGLLAYVYLGAAVLFTATGSAFIICRYDPFIPLFRMSGSMNMLILAACFLVMGIFVGRPYCRYLCPYGAIMRLLSRISKWRVTITPDECIQCRLCEDACPFGAIEEPTQRETVRSRGKWRLGGLIVLLPVLVAAGVWIGDRSGVPFARMHPVVSLADRMRLEKAGEVAGTTDASDAFRSTGRPVEELYADASGLEAGFVRGGRWFGAFVGVVIGLKLLSLSVRRKRTDYEAERGRCLACGRCFSYCPMEHRRRKINEGLLAEKPIKKPASEEL
ncbi:MAG: 4Fe-4S binding protein, partial [Phycisphaerae bacterium]|nr:4Fe-4S binding protein [Phycisphaerae bacterium]